MFNLVVWSFVMALTPTVLGLAWKLIHGASDLYRKSSPHGL